MEKAAYYLLYNALWFFAELAGFPVFSNAWWWWWVVVVSRVSHRCHTREIRKMMSGSAEYEHSITEVDTERLPMHPHQHRANVSFTFAPLINPLLPG